MKKVHVFAMLVLATDLLFSCSDNPETSEEILGQLGSSSSSEELLNYCVYAELEKCFGGSYSTCPGGGLLSDTCPYNSSSSNDVPSSNSVTSSNSSVLPSSSSGEELSSNSDGSTSSGSVEPSSSSALLAAGCSGKTVNIKLPLEWESYVYAYWEGNFIRLGAKSTSSEWTSFKFSLGLQNDMATKTFILTDRNSHYEAAGIWHIDRNTIAKAGNFSLDNGIACSAFGSGDVLYISEDPNIPGKTLIGTLPPSASDVPSSSSVVSSSSSVLPSSSFIVPSSSSVASSNLIKITLYQNSPGIYNILIGNFELQDYNGELLNAKTLYPANEFWEVYPNAFIESKHDIEVANDGISFRIIPQDGIEVYYAIINTKEVRSSSSSQASSSSEGLCIGFVNGTERLHHGRYKAQFCDERDGTKYVYVTIGTQIWMAENLNYRTTDGTSRCYPISGTTNPNDDDNDNCNTYGRLYDWATAMNNSESSDKVPSGIRGVCPEDWHLPSRAEWEVMTASIGGVSTEGRKLKATSGWNSNGNGTDDYGFSALPGGDGDSDGSFSYVGYTGYWWSASEYNSNGAHYRNMGFNSEFAYWTLNVKSVLFSVRCLQD